MKKLELPRTVVDVKYEARDGKVFDSSSQCESHETRLDFEEFKFDDKKANGPLTVENWKHYMYKFLQLFAFSPISEAHLIQESYFSDYKEKKFSLDKVKRYFADEFYHIQSYEKQFERENWNNGHGPYANARRLYKEDFDFLSLYRFMFESELLNINDILRKSEFFEEEEDLDIKKKEQFYEYVFNQCLAENSTEAMDIAIKYLGMDLLPIMSDKKCNSFGGGSRNLRLDFFSSLVCGKFDRYSNKEIDDSKRLKWVEYFLEKDVPLQLFRFSTTTTFIKDGKRWWTGVKEGEEKLFHYPISELINEIKSLKNRPEIFIFSKTSQKMAELFEKKCGPRFIKANEKNKLPEYYELAIRTCEIFKEIFDEHPDILIDEDDSNLFSFSRIVEENMSSKAKNAHDNRQAKEITFKFKLKILNEDHDGVYDVCVVYNSETNSRYNRDKNEETVLNVFKLKDFLGKPDKLAMELSYHLNLCTPLGLKATEKVKEIDAKLFELEKKKEALLKEEELLQIVKKESMVKINKKGK